MNKKNNNVNDINRLLEWVLQYPGYWTVICNNSEEDFKLVAVSNVIKKLAKKKDYKMILMTLINNCDKKSVRMAIASAIIEIISKNWDEKQYQKFIKILLEYLE